MTTSITKTPPNLLDMPKVPLTTIVEYLGPAATVSFALTCTQVESFIKTLNLNVESISLEINHHRCEIRLQFFYSNRKLTWKFLISREEDEGEEESVKCSKKKNNKSKNTLIEKCQEPLEVMKKRVEWLTTLIRFPVTNVHIIGVDFSGTENLLLWPQIHQCERLSVDLIVRMNGSLAPFKDLERLELVSCDWLKPSDLKNLDIANISIFSSDWNSQDLGLIVREWTTNEANKKLETLTINVKYAIRPEQVFEGLDTDPWDPERRQQEYPSSSGEQFDRIDLRSALDIERRTDGLLASILIHDCMMDFMVWHKRFPDLEMETEDS